MEVQTSLIPFEGKPIRKIWHNDEWYFSVVDIIYVLTDSPIPRNYLTILKNSISTAYKVYAVEIESIKF